MITPGVILLEPERLFGPHWQGFDIADVQAEVGLWACMGEPTRPASRP